MKYIPTNPQHHQRHLGGNLFLDLGGLGLGVDLIKLNATSSLFLENDLLAIGRPDTNVAAHADGQAIVHPTADEEGSGGPQPN